MTVAIDLPNLRLSKDERETYLRLRKRLADRSKRASKLIDIYEASHKAKQFDIAIPPQLRNVFIACGWPGTVVDVLEERVRWDNFTGPGDLMGLDEDYALNGLAVVQGHVHLDAFTAGVGLVATGRGEVSEGEAETLITAESPKDCTFLWDTRRRRVGAALSRTVSSSGVVTMESLYLDGLTISLERSDTGRMEVVRRDEHGLPVPVTPFFNRQRGSRDRGRSEITKPLRYYTDAAIRTLLAMEVNREFYTAPQRYLLGADDEAFEDAEGNVVSGWEAIIGRLLVVGPTEVEREDGSTGTVVPTVGQFAQSSPQPYIEQIRMYAHLVATESGLPSTYLGMVTENPASAQAMRTAESRLAARAKARQDEFTLGWREVARNAVMLRRGRGGADLKVLAHIRPDWVSPFTTSPEASADMISKLVSSEVLPPDSEVTYKMIGLESEDRAALTQEKRRTAGRLSLQQIADAADAARTADPALAELNARTDSGDEV